jgi:hypothetical protein
MDRGISDGVGEKRSVPERRLPFVTTDLEEIAAYGAVFGACLSLHLEVRRIAGQARVKAKGGWVSLDRISLERVGLANRFARYRAVQRLQALGWLEVRGDAGSKLEYRVPPNWAKPKAEVIDLATQGRRKSVDRTSGRSDRRRSIRLIGLF